jgi:hypothetical protein
MRLIRTLLVSSPSKNAMNESEIQDWRSTTAQQHTAQVKFRTGAAKQHNQRA